MNQRSSSRIPRRKVRLVVRRGRVLLEREKRREGGAKRDRVPVPVLSGRTAPVSITVRMRLRYWYSSWTGLVEVTIITLYFNSRLVSRNRISGIEICWRRRSSVASYKRVLMKRKPWHPHTKTRQSQITWLLPTRVAKKKKKLPPSKSNFKAPAPFP